MSTHVALFGDIRKVMVYIPYEKPYEKWRNWANAGARTRMLLVR